MEQRGYINIKKRLFKLKIGIFALGSILGLITNAPCEDRLFQGIGPFGGINNTDNPLVIGENQAQNLLNVDITPGGKSVKKRSGYGLAYSLSHTTSTAHGTHFFYNSSGNDVALFFNDRDVSASVNGGQPTVLTSTRTFGATSQCVDSQGHAYCVNTSRDPLLKTDGVSLSHITKTSTGTIIAVTPERLVMAGFSDYPNRVDFSQANDFTNWTVGGEDYSPVNFTITAAGPRITHLTYAHQRVYWFKNTSFGYILDGPTLGDWTVRVISPNVGSLDNTSVYWNGILYFRGQDSHIYGYDGANLTKLTRDMEATIRETLVRSVNAWTQTTQVDFELGTSSADLSTSLYPGSVVAKVASFTYTTIISSRQIYGTTYYLDTSALPTGIKTLWPDDFNTDKYTFEAYSYYSAVPSYSITSSSIVITCNTGSGDCGLRTKKTSDDLRVGTTIYINVSTANISLCAWGLVSDTRDDCLWNAGSSGYGSRFCYSKDGDQVVWAKNGTVVGKEYSVGGKCPGEIYIYVSTTVFQMKVDSKVIIRSTQSVTDVHNKMYFQLSGYNSSKTATLRIGRASMYPQVIYASTTVMDTGILYPKFSTYSAVIAGTGTVTGYSRVSSDGTTFDAGVALTPGSVVGSAPKRYITLDYRLSQTDPSGAPLSVTSPFFSAGSSGTFLSQVNYAPNFTAWDAMNATNRLTDGTQVFMIRGSTQTFTVQSSTPGWVTLTPGAIPSITSGTYQQLRCDIIARSSGIVALDDFVFNWYEGAAEDKPYASYHDNGIWWAIASGTGTTRNNKVLRYDLVNPNTWTIYDIVSNGFYLRNQSLYFADSNAGYIYRYGTAENDNGVAINSYWKSKDFFGDSPFTDKEFSMISIAADMVENSTLDVRYTIDGSTNSSYSLPLTATDSAFIKYNKNLPVGRTGSYFNLQFGNNASDQPWEVFGCQYGYRPKPMKVGY